MGPAGQGRFIQQIRLDPRANTGRYPFTLPMVRHLAAGHVDVDLPVTFLVGDNGTGKSTLIEAVAVAAGFNAEGGSQNFRFATRATESSLGDALILRWGTRKPRTGFFLRAESYYNVASEIERLDHDPGSPPLLPAYGGVSPHARSHGQSFLDLVTHRFGPRGLYILDEPEAALSVNGCLAMVARMHELVDQGSQFIAATHSPILLAVPGARILQIDANGTIEPVDYDHAEPVMLSRRFLTDPARMLRHLLSPD